MRILEKILKPRNNNEALGNSIQRRPLMLSFLLIHAGENRERNMLNFKLQINYYKFI